MSHISEYTRLDGRHILSVSDPKINQFSLQDSLFMQIDKMALAQHYPIIVANRSMVTTELVSRSFL